nr:immunoglobulin heavy chain junction region [Mus musculus]
CARSGITTVVALDAMDYW